MKRTVVDILDGGLRNEPQLRRLRQPINKAFRLLVGCFRRGNKLLVCGNGGSAADAEHIVGELMNRFGFHRVLSQKQIVRLKAVAGKEANLLISRLQPALPAISLVSQTALITAVANDLSADLIFAQQVYGYGRAGDVLMAISTSGNSTNVILAAKVAVALRMKVIALSGGNGGQLASISDVSIIAPSFQTYRIQQYHQLIYHTLCSMLEREFFAPAQQC